MVSKIFFLIILVFLLFQNINVMAADRNYAHIVITIKDPGSPVPPPPTIPPGGGGGFFGGSSLCGNGILNKGEECEFDSECSNGFECFSCKCSEIQFISDDNKPVTRTIFDFNVSEKMSYENLLNLFAKLELPFIHGFARTIDARKLLKITKNIKILEYLDSEKNVSYQTIFTLKYKNDSIFKIENLELSEKRASFIQSYSEIYSNKGMYLISPNFFGFKINSLKPGNELTIQYSLNKFVEPSILMQSTLPVSMIKNQGEVLCEQIQCNDSNPCTVDSCSVGNCVYKVLQDGQFCGLGLSCFNGECVEKKEPVNILFSPYFFAMMLLGFSLVGIHLIYTYKHLFHFK